MGFREREAFFHIYNWWLDESAAVDQDSPNQTYGARPPTLGPTPKFLISFSTESPVYNCKQKIDAIC